MIFMPCNFPLLMSTHQPKLEVYPFGNLNSLTQLQIETHWNFVNAYVVFGFWFNNFASINVFQL